MIKIVYYTETIDNWGRTESSRKPEIIYDILRNHEGWSDDMMFEDSNRNFFSIDDLVGENVVVEGFPPFHIDEDGVSSYDEESDDIDPAGGYGLHSHI